MKEYDEHLNRVKKMFNGGDPTFYKADSYPWGEEIKIFHPLKDWASQEKATAYLDKFWLNNKEYLLKWKPKQDRLFFNEDNSFPKMVFRNQFLIYPTIGGKLFGKWNIGPINNCLKEINEKSIVCIQNSFNGDYIGLNEGSFNKTQRIITRVGISPF